MCGKAVVMVSKATNDNSICIFDCTLYEKINIVVVLIYPPVTGQRQTLPIGSFAHFSIFMAMTTSCLEKSAPA